MAQQNPEDPSKDSKDDNTKKRVKDKSAAKKSKEEDEGLSDEAKKKKDDVAMLVERLHDLDPAIVKLAIDTICNELREATTSMTSVPLTLKFLRFHFAELEEFSKALPDTNVNKKSLADILAVISSTFPNEERKALKYSLAGTQDNLTSWGHEFLRNISTEIVAEIEAREQLYLKNASETGEVPDLQDLLKLVFEIVPFYMEHHNEVDAIDLLVEVQKIEAIPKYVDHSNYQKVTRYLMALANLAASHDDFVRILTVVYDTFRKENELCQAARVALRMRDKTRVIDTLSTASDRCTKLQIAYLLAANNADISPSDSHTEDAALGEEVEKILSNEWLTTTFKMLAKELDVEEPKLPEDIYKTHLEDRRRLVNLDSAKENLAGTFVNAFVNAGFCRDGLITVDESTWVFKNKEQGITAAAASLGAIMMWDLDNGLSQIDKYQWAAEPLLKAGALMAFGLLSNGIKSEIDPAYSLLVDQLDSSNATEKVGAILGLAFAYVGCPRDAFLELFVPLIIDTNVIINISAFASLALGLCFLGTGNQTAAEAIVQTLLERQMIPGGLDGPVAYLFGLSLSLLFLGQKSECEATLEVLEAIAEHPIQAYTCTCIMGTAYAGSGDVTKIQQFLKMCVEDTPSTTPAEDSANKNDVSVKPTSESPFTNMQQAAAVLAMPLVALGEDVGGEMIYRMIDHILQYGNLTMKRAVPLALALSAASNPKPAVIELLSRLTHEADPDVSLHAIFALGIVGAGTNNSRIAELLRQLASYYARAAHVLFAVRLSQGLLYMGKGLMSLSCLHSDRFLINQASLGCLLVVLHSSLFMKETILGNYSSLLFFIIPTMRPRMLVTVDENLQPLPVMVRVGQAVDTTGQAGNPRTVTGFQTHTTPVLLSEGDRAELGTTDYEPVSSLPLEGIVILRPTVSSVAATKS